MRTVCAIVAKITLPLLLVWFSYAQIPHSMTEANNVNWGGTNYIVGTVFWPNGKRVDTRIPVKLRSDLRGDYTSSTDDSGQFIFGGVPEGRYWVVLDTEKEFESIAQPVEVILSNVFPKPVYTLMIRLADRHEKVQKPAVIHSGDAEASKKADLLFKEALELSKVSDHQGAVEKLKLSLAENPKFLSALNELGVQYMKLNELEEADETFKAALKINADSYEPLVNRGITLFRLKKFTDAESILQAAITIKSESAVAHYYLGRTRISLEKYEAAETELNAAIKFGGDDMKEGHRMLANLFIKKGDDNRAIEELEVYLRLVPGAPDADDLRNVIVQLKTPHQPSSNVKPQ